MFELKRALAIEEMAKQCVDKGYTSIDQLRHIANKNGFNHLEKFLLAAHIANLLDDTATEEG